MPFIPKIPAACVDLDLVLVAQTLAKHFGYIPAAARELNLSTPDLRHLTWSKPHLLDEAHEEMEVFVIRALSEVIKALHSDDLRRQMWASDKILSSWLARDHPLAPARGTRAKHFATGGIDSRQIVFRWRGESATRRTNALPSRPRPSGSARRASGSLRSAGAIRRSTGPRMDRSSSMSRARTEISATAWQSRPLRGFCR
jgi:hypothetical protein